MSNKSNNATFNRPAGNRVIDAPVVTADIDERVQQLKSEEAWQKNNRNSITLFKTEGYSIVLAALREAATVTDNITDGILSVQVLEGSIEITTEEGIDKAGKGELVVIHRTQQHTVKAVAESLLLLSVTGDKSVY